MKYRRWGASERSLHVPDTPSKGHPGMNKEPSGGSSPTPESVGSELTGADAPSSRPPQAASSVREELDMLLVHFSEISGGSREVLIEHAGQRYRLRQTRNGGLILTK